jgi:uncharacterized protein YbjT (DUF2867 family)
VGADLGSGAGLDEAVQGVDTVVHLASDPGDVRRVDVEGTDRLLHAARGAGVGHLVYLSIVGCDRNPLALYRAKTDAEAFVLDGRVPGTVLRATQFHDFVAQTVQMMQRGPFMPLPKGMRGALVDLRDVSDRLVGLVESGPAGGARDLGGPEVLEVGDAVTRWARAVGRRVPRIVRIPAVGGVMKAFASGSNLPGPDADRGTRTFAAWLDEQRAGAAAG